MRIAFLGLGLIGGSLARALHDRAPNDELVGWTPAGSGPARAVAEGVLSRAAVTLADAVAGADLIVIGAPPLAAIELVPRVAALRGGALDENATVTDVASTKALIVAAADRAALPFVGGHPMAGRETSGYGAAEADLFVDRPWVIVSGAAARPLDVERVSSIATLVGARPIVMGAVEHDAAVAAISHLPLVLSAALVEAVVGEGSRPGRSDWTPARLLAAGGWRDMTRLARGDVDMGTGIAATNATALAARIRDVREVLDNWLADLDREEGPDAVAIADRLRNARERLES